MLKKSAIKNFFNAIMNRIFGDISNRDIYNGMFGELTYRPPVYPLKEGTKCDSDDLFYDGYWFGSTLGYNIIWNVFDEKGYILTRLS